MKSFRFFSTIMAFILLLSLLTPVRAAEGDVGEGEVQAKAAIMADPDTGEILFARNIHEKLSPASLTMMMTALLVLEEVDRGTITMDTVFTVTESAVAGISSGAGSAGFLAGEELTVEQLLYCITVVSANDACNILAEGVSGSVSAFVEKMNQRAAELGCTDTQFTNANGLQNVDHYSSAWDLYLIAREASAHELFMRMSATKAVEVPQTNLSKARRFWTTNYLLDTNRSATWGGNYLYRGAKGLKAGSLNDAEFSLAAYATRDDRSLLTVVLGASRINREDGGRDYKSFSETIRLMDWGFEGFTRQVILSEKELIDEVPVTLSQEQNTVKLHPSASVERLVPSDLEVENIRRTVTLTSESVEAPVVKGQVLGQLTLSYGDTVYATVDLLADEDVSASRILVARQNILDFLRRPILKLIAAAIAALVVLILLLRVWFASRSRRRRQGRAPKSVVKRGGYKGRRR